MSGNTPISMITDNSNVEQSELVNVVVDLRDSLSEHQDLLSELMEQLGPILMPIQPNEDTVCDDKDKENELCDFGAELRSLRYKIDSQNEAIRITLGRLAI